MLKLEFDEQNIQRALAYVERIGFRGIGDFQQRFFTRLGALVLQWIGQNFETGGQLVGGWPPLRPSTLFGRRQGSDRPLQNTGRLRQSFIVNVEPSGLTVGSPSQIALYHNLGTRPYDIYPRNKKALAFMAPQGNVLRERPYGTPRIGIVGRSPMGQDLQSLRVVKHVHHPGLPVRRMIPNDKEVAPLIQEAARSFREGS